MSEMVTKKAAEFERVWLQTKKDIEASLNDIHTRDIELVQELGSMITALCNIISSTEGNNMTVKFQTELDYEDLSSNTKYFINEENDYGSVRQSEVVVSIEPIIVTLLNQQVDRNNREVMLNILSNHMSETFKAKTTRWV